MIAFDWAKTSDQRVPIRDVAAGLGIGYSTLCRMDGEGKTPPFEVIRGQRWLAKDDLNLWLEANLCDRLTFLQVKRYRQHNPGYVIRVPAAKPHNHRGRQTVQARLALAH